LLAEKLKINVIELLTNILPNNKSYFEKLDTNLSTSYSEN
jgi:hypothetical protein